MTVRERILTIRLMEKAKWDPEYAKWLGVEIKKNNIEKDEEIK